MNNDKNVTTSLKYSLQDFPIQWASFIRSVVLCSCAFGLKLTGEQIAAIMLVVETGLTVYTHQQITNADVEAQNEIIEGTNHRPDSPTSVIVR